MNLDHGRRLDMNASATATGELVHAAGTLCIVVVDCRFSIGHAPLRRADVGDVELHIEFTGSTHHPVLPKVGGIRHAKVWPVGSKIVRGTEDFKVGRSTGLPLSVTWIGVFGHKAPAGMSSLASPFELVNVAPAGPIARSYARFGHHGRGLGRLPIGSADRRHFASVGAGRTVPRVDERQLPAGSRRR